MVTSDMCQVEWGAPKTPSKKKKKIFFGLFHLCFIIAVLLTDDWYTTYDPPDVTLGNNLTGEDEHFVKEVAVHQKNVLTDMIGAFSDDQGLKCKAEIVFIGDRGNIEEARGSGVTREAISIFLREFFSSLSIGAAEKCQLYDMLSREVNGKVLPAFLWLDLHTWGTFLLFYQEHLLVPVCFLKRCSPQSGCWSLSSIHPKR